MTRYVVRKLAAELENRQASVDVLEIENQGSRDISIQDYDAVGIAYPVHSLNAPKIVVDFVRGLQRWEGKPAFVLCTVGEDSIANSASSELLIRLLQKKGFTVFFEKKFTMPSNFIIKDGPESARAKLEKVDAETPSAVDGILNNSPFMIKAGFFAKLLSYIGRVEWLGTRFVKFYSDSECDGCGICAAKCPNHNIAIEDGGAASRAVFKWDCGLCMRCLYLCPQRAIHIRFPMKFIAFEKWYEDDVFRL